MNTYSIRVFGTDQPYYVTMGLMAYVLQEETKARLSRKYQMTVKHSKARTALFIQAIYSSNLYQSAFLTANPHWRSLGLAPQGCGSNTSNSARETLESSFPHAFPGRFPVWTQMSSPETIKFDPKPDLAGLRTRPGVHSRSAYKINLHVECTS